MEMLLNVIKPQNFRRHLRRFSTDKFRTFDETTIDKLPFGSNYFEWVEADYGNGPLDIHTETASESPLLSRNNTGMGFLILNSAYTGISQVNGLYRRLADLETNVYKRFVVVTSMTRELFSRGSHPLEIAMFIESIQKLSKFSNTESLQKIVLKALEDYLCNVSDLSHLILSYKKPLVVYANGETAGYGICLSSLSNTSACYNHSTFRYNNLECAIPPIGGLSFILGLLRGSLGEYLVLTGRELKGSELIWAGLINRFISPDAIGVMQLTADRLVDLPEKETERYLQEHYLPIDDNYTLRNYEWLIHEHFKHDTLREISESLKKGAETKVIKTHNIKEDDVRTWEHDTLKSLPRNSILIEKTLELIRKVKSNKLELLKKLQITPKHWQHMQQRRYKPVTTVKDMSELTLLNTILDELLVEALRSEMNASAKLIRGRLKFKVDDIEWDPVERSGFALSSIPGLRKLHPNYNHETDCDHDKIEMQRQVTRWKDDFLQKELELMRKILV